MHNGSILPDRLPPPKSPEIQLKENIKITLFILTWYTASSFSNNTNKQILSILPRPMLLTLAQLFFVCIFCAIYLSITKQFRIFNRNMMLIILPLAFTNFFSHFFAYVALKDIAVSFINTIKASSPIFTVILSYIFLGKKYSFSVLITLIPIVLGVSICTFSELASLWGIIVTLFSTLVLVAQNIYSKQIFQNEKVHQIVLVMNVAGCAFIANLPLYLYFDFFGDVETISLSQAMIESNVLLYFILNGFFHFIQNVMAFTILSIVSPVTYSVANTLKRVFVIVVSILWFQNEITPSNGLGIIVALIGIFLYNRARVIESELKLRKTYSV